MADVNVDKGTVDMEAARKAEMQRRREQELAGLDDPFRAAGLSEREEFDAEYRAQAPDAQEWVVHQPIAGLDYREISVKDWQRAGVNVEEQGAGYVRWDAANDWRIPRGMLDFLSEGQFNQFILKDGRFRVVEDR